MKILGGKADITLFEIKVSHCSSGTGLSRYIPDALLPRKCPEIIVDCPIRKVPHALDLCNLPVCLRKGRRVSTLLHFSCLIEVAKCIVELSILEVSRAQLKMKSAKVCFGLDMPGILNAQGIKANRVDCLPTIHRYVAFHQVCLHQQLVPVGIFQYGDHFPEFGLR